MAGVYDVNIPEQHTYGYWYELSANISRATAPGKENYSLVYDIIWPYVKDVFYEYRNENHAMRLIWDNINQRLVNIKREIDGATQAPWITDVAFRSCVYAAERWDFDEEESKAKITYSLEKKQNERRKKI